MNTAPPIRVNAGAAALVHVSAIGADSESDSEYAVTKAEGEKAVRQAFPNAVILRPSIIFGPEDSFFNKFASLARFTPALPLIGGGRTRCWGWTDTIQQLQGRAGARQMKIDARIGVVGWPMPFWSNLAVFSKDPV